MSEDTWETLTETVEMVEKSAKTICRILDLLKEQAEIQHELINRVVKLENK